MPRELVGVLLDEIGNHSATVAKILNRELDPMILEFINENNIPIFPSRWSDINMRCSCPDWAVPCKHIAAVIYLIAKQIDGNPFLVFSLCGIDLAGEMKTRDVLIVENEDLGIRSVTDLFQQKSKGTSRSTGSTDALSHQFDSTQVGSYKDLDYSKLPSLKEPLIQALADNPTFFTGANFTNTYKKLLDKTVKCASSQLAFSDRSIIPKAIGAKDKPQFIVDLDYRLHLDGMETISNLGELIASLPALNEDDLLDFQPEINDVYHAYMTSLQLIAHGAIIPEIFKADSYFVIRWLPALIDEELTRLIKALSTLVNSNLVTVEDSRNTHSLSSEITVITLLSIFIDKFIGTFSCADPEKPQRDDVIDLFFGGQRAKFDRPGQSSITKGIAIWLERLHISNSDYLPVLMVTERKNDFAPSAAVEEPLRQFVNPVPLSKIMSQKKWDSTRYSILQKLLSWQNSSQRYMTTFQQMPRSLFQYRLKG